jgi:hypothetical protein
VRGAFELLQMDNCLKCLKKRRFAAREKWNCNYKMQDDGIAFAQQVFLTVS